MIYFYLLMSFEVLIWKSICFVGKNLNIIEDSTIEESEAVEPKAENSQAELNSGTVGHENNSSSKDDSSWMNNFGTDWSLDDPASLSGRPPGNYLLYISSISQNHVLWMLNSWNALNNNLASRVQGFVGRQDRKENVSAVDKLSHPSLTNISDETSFAQMIR